MLRSVRGPTHVFAYGSNLDVDRMVDRVPSARVVGSTRLAGYELRFHKRGQDGTGKANARETGDTGAVLHGAVYEVDELELPGLDSGEDGYDRRLMTFAVATPNRMVDVEAWIYLALPDKIDGELVPAGWYRDHVLRGALTHGLPASLIAWLEAHPTEG